ncbi:MAG: ATP-binding cassette domain-containing protein, partial [Bacteroidota bacterium]
MNEEDDFIVKAEKVSVQRGAAFVLKDISFVLREDDHLAIIGASGSGKTTLGLALAGRTFYKGKISFASDTGQNIVWIEQQHHFKNLSNTTDLYYQQRFNSYDSEQTQTVEEALGRNETDNKMILEMMKIEYLRNKPLIQLSNGENKKLQIAKALLSQPSALIMDQPFIGLDTETREFFHDLIDQLVKQGILIILITAPDEIPECITKVLSLENGNMKSIEDKEGFLKRYSSQKNLTKSLSINSEKLKELSNSDVNGFHYAIKMRNVKVQYGDKKILQDINWEVKRGERWLLSGANGAGKSTLLSLVTADNPQAYANEIYLFDRRRGTGESIWDIKKKIGYLSPELHLFFDQSSTCFEAVASGLFDTIGLFRQLSDADIKSIEEWMEITGIGEWKYKRLYELSTGEQRLVLLVRALVKNPPLLILDEPCQGLDKEK